MSQSETKTMPEAKRQKNCKTCSGLNYYEGNEYEGEGPNGYFCENRVYKSESAERKHLRQLESEQYQKRFKKCWDDPFSVRMPYE